MLADSALAEIAATVYRAPWSRQVAGDVRYALLPRPGEIVVALPGTHPADALDWLRDFSLWPVWAQGIGFIHAGFGLGARAAWAEMAPILSTDKLITFTGHSLGGGLALALAAMHVCARPTTRFRVVTFGAPRVAFLNPGMGRLLRLGGPNALYARAGDIVPNLPLPPLYRHPLPLTRIGVEAGDVLADHAVARYAADLQARERAGDARVRVSNSLPARSGRAAEVLNPAGEDFT